MSASKRTITPYFSVALLLCAGVTACTSTSADRKGGSRYPSGDSDPVESIRVKYHLPALAIEELKNGKITESNFRGVRKMGDSARVEETDQFHLGSCTKAMTATLIGMLVEEGKIGWTSTLESIFPDLQINDAYRSATVEMLLAHRGGIPSKIMSLQNGVIWNALENPSLSPSAGRDLYLRAVLSEPPQVPPGSQYVYSNGGYMILGSIIDRVTGKTWESFIQQRLFGPLHMTSCGLGPAGNPNASSPDEPWGHTEKDGVLIPVAPDFDGDNPPALNSAARVHCSLDDWSRFLQMQMDGFNGRHGLLLKPETFQKLQTPYPGQDYTYGGWIRMSRAWAGGPVLMHRGSNTFSLAQVWLAPLKNIGFFGATNADNNAAEDAVPEAAKFLIHKEFGLDSATKTSEEKGSPRD